MVVAGDWNPAINANIINKPCVSGYLRKGGFMEKVILQTKKEFFIDKATGVSTSYDVFYVVLPSLPGVELKLKPADSTCRKILSSVFGLNVE